MTTQRFYGMTRKQRRLTMIGVAGLILSLATILVLIALEDQIVFFQTPSDVVTQEIPEGERFRLGGLVEENSVQTLEDGKVLFKITDLEHSISVSFLGILPDLFREGQGVVTEGVLLPDGKFEADNVLAKHDENYMPKEVADALKEQGVWKGEDYATEDSAY